MILDGLTCARHLDDDVGQHPVGLLGVPVMDAQGAGYARVTVVSKLATSGSMLPAIFGILTAPCTPSASPLADQQLGSVAVGFRSPSP